MTMPLPIHVDDIPGDDSSPLADEHRLISDPLLRRPKGERILLNRRLPLCLLTVTLLVFLLTGCPGPNRTPLSATNVPACGPTISRQQIMLGFIGNDSFPPIREVQWRLRVFCSAPSGNRTFVSSRLLNVIQIPRGEFTLNPADGFEGLGLGGLLEHVESSERVSFTLANAPQAHWCIEGTASFAGNPPPAVVRFGPVTARQVAGQSSLLLNFVATPESGGVSVRPGFEFMENCVSQ